MAPLTWRNVDAPNFSPATSMLELAARSFGSAGNGIGDALSGIAGIQRRNASAAALPILAKVADEQGVDAALSQIEGMVAPQNRSQELLAAMANLRGTTLGYDQTRAGTASVRGQEGRSAEKHLRAIAEEDQLNALAPELLRQRESAYYGNSAPATGAGSSSNVGVPYNDRELLARTIQAEAGGEGPQGMLAAGAVIGNRAKSGKYGAGVRDVVLAPGQFSAWNSITGYADGQGGLDMTGIRPSEDAYKVADQVLSGEYQDPTGGATHYYNPNVANPKWGVQAGGNWTPIGNHVFGAPAGGAPAGGGSAPSNRPARVSDLIGPDNRISASTLLGIAADNYTASDTASRDRDANRDRDFTFDRNATQAQRDDAAFQRSEEQRIINEQADAWLTQNRANLNQGKDEAIRQVLTDPNIQDPRVQDALVARINGDFDKNSSFYNPQGLPAPELTPVDTAMQRALDDISIFSQAYSLEDQGALAEALGATRVDGSEAAGSDLASAVPPVTERLQVAGVDTNSPQIVAKVNELTAKTGLSREVVLKGVLNSLEESFWNFKLSPFSDSLIIDDDRLDAWLGKLTPQEIRRDEQARRERQDIFNKVGSNKAEYQLYRAEYEQIRWHKTKDSEARKKELLSKMEKIQEKVVGLVSQLDTAIGGTASQGAASAPNGAAAALERFAAPQQNIFGPNYFQQMRSTLPENDLSLRSVNR